MLDTHILIWAAGVSSKLSATARVMIEDDANDLMFSVVSLWEIAIKRRLERPDFRVDPSALRGALLGAGYRELPILGPHAIVVGSLPPIHRDPFDRLLVAQSLVEGTTLLTSDEQLKSYPAPIQLV